jgi:hypothetical protein
MPSVSGEIIAAITDHIRKFGGDFTAWCVGTARDWHNPVFESRQTEGKDDDLICREAYTPASARAVRDYFVTECGTDGDAFGEGKAGRFVYAYRKTSHTDRSSPAPGRHFASRRWAA